MSLALANRVEILRDRAAMLARARAFFAERSILEVDVPILSQCASVDAHIELVQAQCMGKTCYLHSSPEYGMKRLLAEGIGDIYQLSHVFRDGERGERHNPEFLMAEWYRIEATFESLIEETLAFITLFLEEHPENFQWLTYEEVFGDASEEKRVFLIEPTLERVVVTDFPLDQAALARHTDWGTAERFEVYFNGVELANGYHELTDPREQRNRLQEANWDRMALKKASYPIDTHFLAALEKGLPDMCGVAVGFDRLMMLRHHVESLDEVLPFSWEMS